MTPGICDEYFKSVKIHTIKGTRHCRSILIANDIVIRPEENNSSLLQHINVLKCSDSYKKYGDIGTNGVIVEDTKQTFDFIFPSQVDFKKQSACFDKKDLFFEWLSYNK